MSSRFQRIKSQLSIEDGSENELRNRSWATAGCAALAATAVFLGIDVGAEEVFYPIAAVSEAVSVYHAHKAGDLAYYAAKNAVSNFFDKQNP